MGRQLLLKSRELHLAGAPHGCRGLVADDSGSGSMVFMPGSRPPTREGLGVAGQVSEPIAAGPSGARGCPVLLHGSLRGLQRRQEPRTSGSTAVHVCCSGASAVALSHLWSPGHSCAVGAGSGRAHSRSAQAVWGPVLRLSRGLPHACSVGSPGAWGHLTPCC